MHFIFTVKLIVCDIQTNYILKNRIPANGLIWEMLNKIPTFNYFFSHNCDSLGSATIPIYTFYDPSNFNPWCWLIF